MIKKNKRKINFCNQITFFLYDFFFTLELKVRKENDKFKFKED